MLRFIEKINYYNSGDRIVIAITPISVEGITDCGNLRIRSNVFILRPWDTKSYHDERFQVYMGCKMPDGNYYNACFGAITLETENFLSMGVAFRTCTDGMRIEYRKSSISRWFRYICVERNKKERSAVIIYAAASKRKSEEEPCKSSSKTSSIQLFMLRAVSGRRDYLMHVLSYE